MSARSLQMIAGCMSTKRGPARRVLGNNHSGTAVYVPPVTIQTTLDRFIVGVESGAPDPFHRSPDREPNFEERE